MWSTITTQQEEQRHCSTCGHTSTVTVTIRETPREHDFIYHWVCPHCHMGRVSVRFGSNGNGRSSKNDSK